jgi:hypothetical protein
MSCSLKNKKIEIKEMTEEDMKQAGVTAAMKPVYKSQHSDAKFRSLGARYGGVEKSLKITIKK